MEDKKVFVVWTELDYEGIYEPENYMRVCVGEKAKEQYIFELRVKEKKWHDGEHKFIGHRIEVLEVPVIK